MAQDEFSWLPFGAGGIPANANSGTSIAAPRWYMGTAIPPAGTYNLGDIVYNPTPVAATPQLRTTWGWICTTAGTPGTWQPLYSPALNQTTTTTATSGTLANFQRLTLINPATTGTYSLPDASAVPAAFEETFKNIASGSVTLTPLASNNYADAAAITLAQFASVTLLSNGGTTWYRQQ